MLTVTNEAAATMLRPRKKEAHKGDYGILTLVCGSTQYRGAASLALEGALRSGVGIARLCSIESVIATAVARSPEGIFLPLAEENGQIALDAATAILTQKSTALLCGCGMVRGAQTLALTQALLSANLPTVLDAGALTSLADVGAQHLLCRNAPTVITPHIGEMAALCEHSIEQVSADMEGCATSFAKTHGCVVVLKSHRTVIAYPDGTLWECTLGSHGLARGGSGDVLAGTVASFLAQGYTAMQSTVLGTWLHASASQIAQQKSTAYAMLPRELPDCYGLALSSLS